MKKKSGFTLVEMLVAMTVFGLFCAALLTSWVGLQTTAMNTTSYARRQSDQMRVIDYVKRDVRRASAVDIYNAGALVTGTAFGSELRLTIPDYYTDAREEDNTVGASTPATPSLSGTKVTHGDERDRQNRQGGENGGTRLLPAGGPDARGFHHSLIPD